MPHTPYVVSKHILLVWTCIRIDPVHEHIRQSVSCIPTVVLNSPRARTLRSLLAGLARRFVAERGSRVGVDGERRSGDVTPCGDEMDGLKLTEWEVLF